MHKKLMLACMGVAAFAAFAIPSAASAATLTSEGKPVPVGTSITAFNTGVTEFTASVPVECDHVHLSGTVTQNNTTGPIKGEITTKDFKGTGPETECTSPAGSVNVTVNSRLCLETTTEDKFKVTGCGANVTFTLVITNVATCKYSAASVSGTFTTNSTPVTATISEQPALKEEGGIFCPNEGKLDMDFNLHTTGATTTSTGTGLTIS